MNDSKKEIYLFIALILGIIIVFMFSIMHEKQYERKLTNYINKNLIKKNHKLLKLESLDQVVFNGELITIEELDNLDNINIKKIIYYVEIDKNFDTSKVFEIPDDFFPIAIFYEFKTISSAKNLYNELSNEKQDNPCELFENKIICEYSLDIDIEDIQTYIISIGSNLYF